MTTGCNVTDTPTLYTLLFLFMRSTYHMNALCSFHMNALGTITDCRPFISLPLFLHFSLAIE